jgi:peptide/nickel transport system ATP-binding protein
MAATDLRRAVGAVSVDDLSVTYNTPWGPVDAVRRVSLRIQPGEILGLVGESGSGKTTFAKAILRLLPPNAKVAGRVQLFGTDILSLAERDFRRLRWRRIAMVPQSAMQALSPVERVRTQMIECFRTHGMSATSAHERAKEVLGVVGLAARVLDRYPHQLSGGMKQRVVIAMAIALEPDVIIADEPTTGLDMISQSHVLTRLHRICRNRGAALVLVTHDVSLLDHFCDRVAVMYRGRVVEEGPTDTVLGTPAHPYTMGLLAACPRIRGPRRRLISIRGDFENTPPSGCSFAPRCPFAVAACRADVPPLVDISTGHSTACLRYPEAAALRARAEDAAVWQAPTAVAQT